MTEKLNIYQRLLRCMEEVQYIQKESKKVNNQYTFVSHDAVSKKCRPAFIDNGVLPIPHVVRRENNGNRVEIDMTVEFVNVDDPADRITVESFGFGIDPQDKGPGKAMSYAYKYALLKALALETGDDPERDMIPHDTTDPAEVSALAKRMIGAIDSGDALAAYEIAQYSDEDVYTEAFNNFPTGKKTEMKKLWRDLEKQGKAMLDDLLTTVHSLCEARDPSVLEYLGDLSETLKKAVWGQLDATQRAFITEAKRAAA